MIKNITASLITFLFLISLIPIVFSLDSGFMTAEIIILVALIIFGATAGFRLIAGAHAWNRLFVFNIIGLVNLFVIYGRNFDFSSVSAAMLLGLIGLFISAFNIKSLEDVEVEPYYEEQEKVEKKEKKTRKKSK